MKTTLLIAIIISAALLITLAADVNKEPETFYTAFDQAQSPLVLRVPNSKLAGISEYGFSLWIKFSHFSPKFMFPAWVRDRWMGIAHVTEKEHTCSNNWQDRTLSTFLWPADDGRKQRPAFHMPTYDYNIKDTNRWDQDLDFPEDDLYESWIFIYQGYDQKTLESFRLIKTTFTKTVGTGLYTNIKHQSPVEQLKFRLGNCADGHPSWNGKYYNVNFFYGSSGMYLKDEASVISFIQNSIQPKMPLLEKNTYQLIQGEKTREYPDPAIERYFEKEQEGQSEYAYWGWVRWNVADFGQHDWHLVGRLAKFNNEALGNADKPGDRTLSLWVGKGYYHFTTYTQGFKGGDNWNVVQNINYDDQLFSWTFIYYGYQRDTRTAFGYIKFFNEKEKFVRFENINHLVFRSAFFQLGKDKWHSGFNGQMKDWFLSFGPGSYRETNFKELYEATQLKFGAFDLEEPKEPKPEMHESAWNSPMIKTIEVPKEELATIIDYSFSMWVRFSFSHPTNINWGVMRGNWLGIASITEKLNACPAGYGDRTLGLWHTDFNQGQLGYHFTTYNQKTGDGNNYKNMILEDKEDFDGNWNWIYFGYSIDQQKVFAYTHLSRSQKVQTLSWDSVIHYKPPQALKFNLGRCWEPHPQWQGHYYNVQFYYKGQNFMSTREHVESYFNRVSFPDKYLPMKKPIKKSEFEGELKRDVKDTSLKVLDIDAAGAEEYAVYGWAKWVHTTEKSAWHNIFRLTDHKDKTEANLDKTGDRTLCLWVGAGYLHFTTYTFGFQGGDNGSVVKNMDYLDDLEQWFFVYFGYSQKSQNAFAFVKWQDRQEQFLFTGIKHFKPFNLRFYLGKDPYHPGFSGDLKGWNVVVGPGAYQTNKFDILYDPHIEVKEPNVSEEWKEEATLVEQNWDSKEYKPTIIPAEKLTDIKGYSFSFWVRFSYNDPKKMPIEQVRANWLGMAGITEKDDYCDWTQYYSRTLALFYRPYAASPIPAYHFTTYATNKNNANFFQNMEFDRDWHDSEWNWVYFGYSLIEQSAFAYVYFGRTGEVKTLTWQQITHMDPPKKLKFFIGTCGQQYPSMNAKYFDIRLRTDEFAYKPNATVINKYFSISVQIPPVLKPTYSEIPIIDCQQSFSQDAKKGIQNDFGSQFSGAEEYAIYGWAKWSTVPNRQVWHNIFRVTINDKDTLTDLSKFGDRTLALWVGPGYLHFTTYNYEMQAGGNTNWQQNIDYGNNLDRWFFVYFGYSFKEKKAFGYVKFADNDQVVYFKNLWHMIPKHFGVFVGKDPFYHAFNGDLKNFKFVVGPGAYREGNLDELYNSEDPQCDDNGKRIQNTVQQLRKIPGKSEEQKVLEVPKEEAEKLEEYGFWMWARFSYSHPQKLDILQEYKINCYSLARITEGKHDAKNLGDRNLAVMICSNGQNPVYYFSTYDKKNNTLDVNANGIIDLDDFDGVWNWVYFAYSQPLKKARGLVYYGKTGTTQFHEFDDVEHTHPLQKLKFMLGKQYQWLGFNGFVDDVQFSTQKGCFKLSQKDISNFLTNDIKPAMIIGDKQLATGMKIATIHRVEDDFKAQEKELRTKIWQNDFAYAEEYAIWGNVKWVSPKKRFGKHLVFRLTTNTQENLNDDKYAGDQVLALFIREKKLSFATYRFDTTPDLNSRIEFEIDESKIENKYFWVYMGYSRPNKQIFIKIKFSDGSVLEKLVDGVRHLNPYFFQFYLGSDPFYKAGKAFNGMTKGFYGGFGIGAFQTQKKQLEAFEKYTSFQSVDKLDEFIPPEEDQQATGEQIPKEDKVEQQPINKQGEPKEQDLVAIEGIAKIEKADAPAGDCAILYSLCDYKGESFNLCKDHANLDVPHDIKSIYVPKKTKVTLYNLDNFNGKKATFSKSVECLDNLDFSILLEKGVKISNVDKDENTKLALIEEDASKTIHMNKQNSKLRKRRE